MAMRLGDLLVAAKLAVPQQIQAAVDRQKTQGGRLGDNLVELGFVDRRDIDRFLTRLPREPATITETGIPEASPAGPSAQAHLHGAAQRQRNNSSKPSGCPNTSYPISRIPSSTGI